MQYRPESLICIDFSRCFLEAYSYCIEIEVFQAIRAAACDSSWIFYAIRGSVGILY